MNKEDTLLLIIDLQEKLQPTIYQGAKIISKAQQIIQAFQIFGIPMIITEQYPKGLGHTIPEITSSLGETPTFEKLTFSGFIPEIQEYLENKAIKNVVLIGTESHICVYQTCKDLLQADYHVEVVKDAISSRTQEHAEHGLELMRDLGASVTNNETLIYEILGAAGTDTFEKILKIIK